MNDIETLSSQVADLEQLVKSLRTAVDKLAEEDNKRVAKKAVLKKSFLIRRKQALAALGITDAVSRSSWSHERGDAIIFDAWQHKWVRDYNGGIIRYPVRTTQAGLYSLQDMTDNPRPGHTRWQHHVDLVLAGKRDAIAIVPVAKNPKAEPNEGTRGWLPQYVTGEIREDTPGNYYFHATDVVPI